MSEIYVVNNAVSPIEKKIVYVGFDAEKAQQVCDQNHSETSPCWIQVWESGAKKHVTRVLK